MLFPTGVFLLLVLLACQAPREPDLLVYGGTPQGITAALSAAQRGLRVTLIEPGPQLGGVVVRSWLATLDDTNDRQHRSLYGGLYAQLYRALGANRDIDVHRAAALFNRVLRQGGVDVRLQTPLLDRTGAVTVRANAISTVWVRHGLGMRAVRPGQVIDATDTAVLAFRAGTRFTLGREDGGLDRRQMAATLVLRLSGVRWADVARALKAARRTRRELVGYDTWGAYGFGLLAAHYVPGAPDFRLRGLNLARQRDGTLLVNALLITGVDGVDPGSTSRAYRRASHEALRVVAFLRRAAPATFGHAGLVAVAPELYLRETRHRIGRVRLHADDVLLGHAGPDSVATGGYSLDGQIYDPREAPILLGHPALYGVPYGTLVPVGLSNLLVVSQAASFDSAAAYSARVVPLQMVLGEVAGTACAVARSQHRALADISTDTLRSALQSAGTRLPPVREKNRLHLAGTASSMVHPGHQRLFPLTQLLNRGLLDALTRSRVSWRPSSWP